MQSLAVYAYIAAVGLVTAGLLASFVQLVSGQPMRFGIEPNSLLASIGAVLLIATLWSLFSGALLLDLILKL